jgi:hypothetical protein
VYAAEVAVLLGVGLLVVLPWLVVRDVLAHPAAAWRAAGRSRTAWIVVVVLVPVLGAALYLRRARPSLRGATSHVAGRTEPPVRP